MSSENTRAFYRFISKEEHLQTLQLPQIYEQLGDETHQLVYLWSTTCQDFEVDVDKDADGAYWFTEGWPDFVFSNRVVMGCSLLFVYEGESHFEVYVSYPDPTPNHQKKFGPTSTGSPKSKAHQRPPRAPKSIKAPKRKK